MKRLGLLVMATFFLAACGMLEVRTAADEACAAPALEYEGIVVGAFNTTIGAIRSLEPLAVDPARWPDLAPDHRAVLCYIDAPIGKAPPPPIDGPPAEPFDRIVVAVVDGFTQMVAAGYRDRLPVTAP